MVTQSVRHAIFTTLGLATLAAAQNTPADGSFQVHYASNIPASQPSCVLPPSGMVSWWPGDGNANDIVGVNTGTSVGGSSFQPGKVGQAFSFNGTNQYVDVGALNLPSTFTIDAWVNPNSLSNAPQIVSKDTFAGLRSYYFQIEAAGTLVASVRNTVGTFTQYRTSVPVISTGLWQHVAVTYDGSAGAGQKMKLYVNGVSYATDVIGPIGGPLYDAGGTPDANALTAKIGIYGDGVSQAFDGLIDEVEMFGRVLAASELQGISNAGAAGKCKPAGASLSGESVVNFTNTGANNAQDICVNTYTFAPDEQLISCCSCRVTRNALWSLRVSSDLISNTLTPAVESSVVIKLLATSAPGSANCNPANPGAPVPGLAAWGTTIHLQNGSSGFAYGSETPFINSTLSGAEQNVMSSFCGFIQGNGSGFGICRSCQEAGGGRIPIGTGSQNRGLSGDKQ